MGEARVVGMPHRRGRGVRLNSGCSASACRLQRALQGWRAAAPRSARPPCAPRRAAPQGFYSVHAVPVIENTARECELTDRLRAAIEAYPQARWLAWGGRGVWAAGGWLGSCCRACGSTGARVAWRTAASAAHPSRPSPCRPTRCWCGATASTCGARTGLRPRRRWGCGWEDAGLQRAGLGTAGRRAANSLPAQLSAAMNHSRTRPPTHTPTHTPHTCHPPSCPVRVL